MAKQKSLKTNFILLAIYKIVLVIAPLIIAPYTSRILGAELIGQYSYYYSLIGYFTLFAGFGFVDYGQKLIAAKRDDKEEYSNIYYSILGAKIILGLLLAIVYFSINFTSGFAPGAQLIFTIMFLHVIGNVINPLYVFMGLEKYKTMTIFVIISKILLILSIFIFVKGPEDFTAYVLIYALSVFLYPIIMLPFLIKILAKPNFKTIKIFPQFKHAFVYFLPVLSISLYSHIDKSMIQWITKSNEQNGYYEQATKLVNVIINGLSALKAVMLSRIAYLYSKGDEEQIRIKTIKALRTLFLIGLPATIGVAVIATNFVPLFFGWDFMPSIEIIYVLAPTVLFTAFKLLLQSLYFAPRNKLWPYNFTILAGALINVGLNVLLIHKWGAFGAGLGSTISEFIVCVILVILARKDIKFSTLFKVSYKPFIATVVMGFFGFALAFKVLPGMFSGNAGNLACVFIEVISCVLIYATCIYLVKEEMFMSTLHLR